MRSRVPFDKVLWGTAAALVLLGSACGLVDNLNKPEDLSIRRFTASSTEVSTGSVVTLSWDVDGAEAIQIDNGIGNVVAKGTRDLRPEVTTTFRLTAFRESASATSTIEVRVRSLNSPSPSPSPTIAPSPSPSPTPTPTPTPSPSPGIGPTPSPSPVARTCGAPALSSVRGCGVVTNYLVRPATGQCLTVNSVDVAVGCPAGANTTREVAFVVTAGLDATSLEWRRSSSSTNLIRPDHGFLDPNTVNRVSFNELVLDSDTTIDIVRGSQVLAQLTIKSR